ncbi:MAG: Poly-beta-1,6-N-acetyl-D-glucosamine export protein [Accumulibacter sp.]|uniref:hypothetical protein n=1 Tax=Accumulibacter sp. TaxID=2053492 RepID=UPI00121BE1AF|nr:hypothetical protein [Accumulibacter sp.]TLD45818.1 MAG: Poly-beta-1,6-N-acetyl-D-glucosamine export protein [Accumulibacter sp.]
MNRLRLALPLCLTLATLTAGAGEEWVMPPKARHSAPAPAAGVGGEDWAPELGRQLAILRAQPDDVEARKAAWVAAMRLDLFTQAAELDAPPSEADRRAMEGDIIALDIRYGIVDRNTLRGPERFVRLDIALTATDALAAGFFTGKLPDAATGHIDRYAARLPDRRHLGWRVTGEVNGGSGVKDGFTGTARWKPDDHWTVYGAGESVTNQIPLRAVADGIHASRVSLGVDWRQHESRKLGGAAYYSDSSDGNLRSGVNALWFERSLSGPKWTFETTLGADASRNSLNASVNYFNPKSDRSLWLTAAVEHLGWRSYDHSLRQRLALTGGTYWQEFYGSGAIEAIE